MGFNVTAYSNDCKQLDYGEMCEDSWNEIEIAVAILEKYGFTIPDYGVLNESIYICFEVNETNLTMCIEEI